MKTFAFATIAACVLLINNTYSSPVPNDDDVLIENATPVFPVAKEYSLKNPEIDADEVYPSHPGFKYSDIGGEESIGLKNNVNSPSEYLDEDDIIDYETYFNPQLPAGLDEYKPDKKRNFDDYFAHSGNEEHYSQKPPAFKKDLFTEPGPMIPTENFYDTAASTADVVAPSKPKKKVRFDLPAQRPTVDCPLCKNKYVSSAYFGKHLKEKHGFSYFDALRTSKQYFPTTE